MGKIQGFAAVVIGLAASPAGGHEDLELQIARLTRELKAQPGSAELHLRRGEVHRQHENWAAARADYAEAERLDPAMASVDLAYGRLWLQAGDARKALAALDRFLGRCPDYAEGWLERGRALAGLGRPGEAEESFTKSIGFFADPRPEHFLERARVQPPDRALAGIEEGLRRLGSVVTLELAALDLEVEARRFDAALGRLGRLAAASPRKETWLARKGEILREAGRAEESLRAFAEALAAIEALPPGRRSARFVSDLERRLRKALEAGHEGR